MKIAYDHIIKHIPNSPSIEELSQKLFQLGHEHEIHKGVFDIEFTPNRGDCLSVLGILRDLKVFYKIQNTFEIYDTEFKELSIDFINHSKELCPKISFLKIKIDNDISKYKGPLKDYFDFFSLNKNNFFTDISNYISYETGQPTHCYDYKKVHSKRISLEKINKNIEFRTLLNKTIKLCDENLVFMLDKEVINLAGVMGGDSTACNENTTEVLIECAYFKPEEIIGKTVKYDIASDAAYKFERGVDPKSHDFVLRRFAQIVSDHVPIKEICIYTESNKDHKDIKIPEDLEKINKILGISIDKFECENIFQKLGFKISNGHIQIPSFRQDLSNHNDLAEEIARVIGYDSIQRKHFSIQSIKKSKYSNFEMQIKELLIDNGFYEVINDPFTGVENKNSIRLDNPLDSNKSFMRSDLESSLISNLTYNERRQKDIVKLFEISDIYSSHELISKKRKIGIICSGRLGRNYRDFSKNIDNNYLNNILKDFLPDSLINIISVSRDGLNSKSKKPIFYLEFEIGDTLEFKMEYIPSHIKPQKYKKYVDISELPSSTRDLSFSIKDFSKLSQLEDLILNFRNKYIKDIFAFDYFINNKIGEIKIGFRFVLQARGKTLTDDEIDSIMNLIIDDTLKIEGVSIPGLIR